MGYTWLKGLDFELGDFFPYLKIILEVKSPWDTEVPFYTFVANFRVQSSDFGHYLYIGDYVNTVIKPKETLSIKTSLRIINVHANEIRRIISNLVGMQQFAELTLHASVDLLNYGNPIGPIVKRFPLTKLQEWIKREGEVKNEFVPAPSHNALISLMYRNIHDLQKGFLEAVENRLKVVESNIKPFTTLFEKGFKKFYQDLEREIENRYRTLMPLAELIKLTTNVCENLDQNWAVSALVLSLLENLVNLKLIKLGEKPEGNFGDRVGRLKDSLVRKENWREKEASELSRKLREKYAGRAIVLHSGHSNPVSESLASEDLEFIKEVVEKLFH